MSIDLSSTASRILNIAVHAPIPTASVQTAASDSAGSFTSRRTASRTSLIISIGLFAGRFFRRRRNQFDPGRVQGEQVIPERIDDDVSSCLQLADRYLAAVLLDFRVAGNTDLEFRRMVLTS